MEQREDDHEEDEMEMSDDDRASSPVKNGPSSSKRAKLDNDHLKVITFNHSCL